MIRKVTISCNDDVYECFPDVLRTRSGKLICVYRESDSHGARDYSHLVLRESLDDGGTWSDRWALVESQKHDGVLFKWNCPRVAQLRDGRLLVACDGYPAPPGEGDADNYWDELYDYFWLSGDEGRSWSGPLKTPIAGIVPDKLVELRSGVWLLATTLRSRRFGAEKQVVHRSSNRGGTWEGPITVCEYASGQPNEGSIVQLPDGELVCYMRNDTYSIPSYGVGLKAFSQDDGATWEGPYEMLIDRLSGRPTAGLLASGHVLITYRYKDGKNFFAYREALESAKERILSKQRGVILPIDHDRSPRADSGYSGWVQLPSGRIFAATYIVDDASRAQIRGYNFTEDDF